MMKLKKFAEENTVILVYEAIKDHIRDVQEKATSKYHFFAPFRSEHPITEHLKEMAVHLEKQRKHRK